MICGEVTAAEVAAEACRAGAAPGLRGQAGGHAGEQDARQEGERPSWPSQRSRVHEVAVA